MRHIALFLGIGLAAAGPLPAQDVGMGRMLAEEYCVACHDIAPGGAFKMDPPSFAAIAVYRSDDQIAARIDAPPLHADMPRYRDYMIAGNTGDMVAYIRSLESVRP